MSDNSDYDFFTQPLIEQLPKAADTLLKSVGLLGVAGFLANLAMRGDSYFIPFVFPIVLWISTIVLLGSGLTLAFVAFLTVERVITKGEPRGKWTEIGIGALASVVLTVSVQAVVWDFIGGRETEKAVTEASAKALE